MNKEVEKEIEWINGMIELNRELYNGRVRELREIKEGQLAPIDLRIKVSYIQGQLDLLVILIETFENEAERVKTEAKRIKKEIDEIEDDPI